MTDSSLPRSNSSESEAPLLAKHLPSLDSTLERCIGTLGWAQFLQAILVSFAWLFDAQQTFISIFTDVDPTWHCTRSDDELCNSAPNPCGLPRSSWSWDNPLRSSIVSEWNLACSGPIIAGLPGSSFFIGCLAGGLVLATLADSSLGRKNMLVLSCMIMSVAAASTVFSPNVWVYSFFRFVSGFGRATIGTAALVLSSELVGKRWRGQVGIIGFFYFTIGFLSLPAIAYLTNGSSWRILYLWTSIPSICYCVLIHFLLHESPRWLLVRGRKEEAIQTLRSIGSRTESSITYSFSRLPIGDDDTCNNNNVDLFSAMKILLGKSWSRRRLSAVMTVGFGIGMVYYGMPLGVGNLAFNLYLSVTFNALSELPSSLITFFLIGKLNRRSSLLIFTMVSGICSVTCVVIGSSWKELQIGLELVSFFSACTAFNVVMIYTLELFPTSVRNSALSIVRQALVFGGVFSPVLVAVGRKMKDEFLSYGVFGLVIGCCGLFVAFLPETKGGTLCDTMDEQEYKETLAASDGGSLSAWGQLC
ncbi:organic cation/carnitine transporter 3-like [Macadamia integrifolia]|uniref:organic cation/carnitine transporter 3-like n=1 Tax=Macadamia integrifolia TaxID=60698 RepID=UPI001C5282CC|nr:organic cation/carnitine transporter 3-like [Macadamia integrifolia]